MARERTFIDSPAARSEVGLMLGLVGCSSSGKTMSALRLGTGIQRVTGGDLHLVDTEARRALHYADDFNFRHTPFDAPFGPLDYLSAIEHCLKRGAKIIIVDSASHAHEGPGGILEMFEAECERLSKGDAKRRERVKFLAWQKPKRELRRLINTILQTECHYIFCFRAKPKLKIVPGKDPKELGFMPIASDEWVYEMTANFLLLPGCEGMPAWQPEQPGERMMIKLPKQFKPIFSKREPLSEAHGETMAKWARGDAPTTAEGTAVFVARLKWPGGDEWGGKPLTDAPLEVLDTYRASVKKSSDKQTGGKFAGWFANHLDQIDSARAGKEPE